MISFLLLALVALALAVISIGVQYGAPADWYSSWPMILLWGATAVTACVVMCRFLLWRRPLTFMVHVSLLLILAGAFVTWTSATNEEVTLPVMDDKAKPEGTYVEAFEIVNYPGTSTPKDFRVTMHSGGVRKVISMNNVVDFGGTRYSLKSYNPETLKVTLNRQQDTSGTLVSYIGYALLALSMAAFLFGRKSVWRTSLRRLAAPLLLVVVAFPASAQEETLVKYLDNLNIYHNDRIAPMATFNADFAKQLTGSAADAREIVYGYLFHFSDWKQRDIIKVKSEEVKKALMLHGDRASYVDFFNAVSSGRLNTERPERMSRAEREDVARFESINMLVSGSLLKLFPIKVDNTIVWMAPTDRLPVETDEATWTFMRKSLGYMNELIQTHRYGDAASLVDKITDYQLKTVGEAGMPSAFHRSVEVNYIRYVRNCLPWAICGIIFGLALLIWLQLKGAHAWIRPAIIVIGGVEVLYLLLSLGMRWVISGHIPLSDGFETMQFMSLIASIAAVAFGCKRGWLSQLGGAASLLVSGLCLMVAAMSGGGASVALLMPVLASPWLSIHVALMMFAYTLFALMAVMGVSGLCARETERVGRLADLCRVMLVPAVFLLAAGIFTGAVWANQSWGRYWGWDPKEVWALISMIVYCFPIHTGTLKIFRSEKVFLLYVSVAFVSILFTYFGVNYLLGGLHSYA